jgi:ankyrin repeat protein
LGIVTFLISQGNVSPNCADRWGGTPLDDAARHGHTEIVTFLKAHGAKIGAHKDVKDVNADLCDAAARGDIDRMRDLRAAGRNLSQGDYDERTALHLGASEGKLEIVQFLILEGKTDPNCADRWGGTPLDDAARHGHTEIVAFLKAHGAKIGTHQDTKDVNADLCDAAARGDVDRMRDLHAAGCDLTQGDYDQR